MTHMNEYSPVLDLKALVKPPAEEQWLWGDFLHVHTFKVDVDPGAFFTQEFCRQNRSRINARTWEQTKTGKAFQPKGMQDEQIQIIKIR